MGKTKEQALTLPDEVDDETARAIRRGTASNLRTDSRTLAVQRGATMLEVAAPKAVSRLIDLLDSPSEPVRLAASRDILDRVYGKPKQSMDVQVTDVSKLHLQYLQEIQARREERMRTIEGGTQTLSEAALPDTNKT